MSHGQTFWFGNEETGLEWCTPLQKSGWTTTTKRQGQEETQEETLELTSTAFTWRLISKNKGVSLFRHPLRFKFGLLPTPAKPKPANYRQYKTANNLLGRSLPSLDELEEGKREDGTAIVPPLPSVITDNYQVLAILFYGTDPEKKYVLNSKSYSFLEPRFPSNSTCHDQRNPRRRKSGRGI